jgi:DNA-binding HxlR family transcriptional regulator
MAMELKGEWQQILRCKWSVVVLAELGDGTSRPSQILRRHSNLKPKVLWQRLRKLERFNLVQRFTFDGYPRRTDYRLTEEGLKLAQWAKSLLQSGLTLDELTTVLRCRYMVAILKLLAQQPRRPKSLRARLKIADKLLFERLAKLERLGLVWREIVPTKPIQVRYHLTERARSLMPLLTDESQKAGFKLQPVG